MAATCGQTLVHQSSLPSAAATEISRLLSGNDVLLRSGDLSGNENEVAMCLVVPRGAVTRPDHVTVFLFSAAIGVLGRS